MARDKRDKYSKPGSTYWESLTPKQRGQEMDDSLRSPGGYAQQNFEHTDPPTTELRFTGGTPKGSEGDPELPKRKKR